MTKDYHCCATCAHFQIQRENEEIRMRCRRLGYQTKASYRFNCWTPRSDIVAKMNAQAGAVIRQGVTEDGNEGG